MKREWVIYRSADRVIVTTPECEAFFREQVATWSLGAAERMYDLDRDFTREVVTDCCVQIRATLTAH